MVIHQFKTHQILLLDKKTIHGGYWNTEKQTAYEYDRLAKIHFGEFALLNFSGVQKCPS